MKRQILFLMLALATLVVGTPSKAWAWGAYHVGYTHVGASGVQHYGRTAVSGPYGSYSGGHASAYGAYGGSYHAGSAYGERYGGASYGGYRYGGSYGGGYAAGGYHYGAGYGDLYRGGVYRAW